MIYVLHMDQHLAQTLLIMLLPPTAGPWQYWVPGTWLRAGFYARWVCSGRFGSSLEQADVAQKLKGRWEALIFSAVLLWMKAPWHNPGNVGCPSRMSVGMNRKLPMMQAYCWLSDRRVHPNVWNWRRRDFGADSGIAAGIQQHRTERLAALIPLTGLRRIAGAHVRDMCRGKRDCC
jgi:hypothetical protein